MIRIHPVDDAILPDYVRLYRALWPLWAQTVEEMRHEDAIRADYLKCARWLACVEDEPVGIARYEQVVWDYEPGRFDLRVGTLPHARGRGVGAALYAQLLDALAPETPKKLVAWVCEDAVEGLRFAERRGFVERMREQMSRLDLATFDPTPFADALARVESQGVRIVCAAAWDSGDTAVRRRMHAVAEAVHRDVPSADPIRPVPYDEWAKRFEHPNYFPEGQLYALDAASGELIGVSSLWRRQAQADLQQGLTGVVRSHRRRGIALALKLRGIAAAQSIGAAGIRTDNAVSNDGMLAINRALGFVPLPAWTEMARETS